MSWIQTYTGKAFDAEFARPEVIDPVDIAHSLARLCRFNGHCREFYSVAQHSIIVSSILPDELKLWGLLHDASEAYIGDIVRPIKMKFPQISQLEELVVFAIAQRFGLEYPAPKDIKHADNVVLATEARDLMGPHPKEWEPLPDPLDETIEPMAIHIAEAYWMQEFKRLVNKENVSET